MQTDNRSQHACCSVSEQTTEVDAHAYRYIEVFARVGVDIDAHHLGAESSRHAVVHEVAGLGQLLRQVQVRHVQSLHVAQRQCAGQEAGQVLLQTHHTVSGRFLVLQDCKVAPLSHIILVQSQPVLESSS